MPPTIYSSSDPGAPVLTGQPGSLTSLLDAVLVDGYGSGANEKTPAGWTRAFQSTNKRAYRNSPIQGTGFYLRVDDTAAVGNARHAWLRGFKTATDVDTGLNPAPDYAQKAAGGLFVKSQTLDAQARPWWIFACEVWAYLFVGVAGDAENMVPAFVGDYESALDPDGLNFYVHHAEVDTYTGNLGALHSRLFYNTSGTSECGYVGRNVSAADSTPARTPFVQGMNGPCYGGGGPDYLPGRRLILLDVMLATRLGTEFVGRLPRICAPAHLRPFANLQIVEDVVALGGRSVIARNYRSGAQAAANYNGQVLFFLEDQ